MPADNHLPGWEIDVVEYSHSLIASQHHGGGGLLGGTAKITIRVEGLEGIPSCTVHVRSETAGGLRSRDKGNVLEFIKPFHRRVC